MGTNNVNWFVIIIIHYKRITLSRNDVTGKYEVDGLCSV